jgi:hypothetical protein
MGSIQSNNKNISDEEFYLLLKILIKNETQINYCDFENSLINLKYKDHTTASNTIIFFASLVSDFLKNNNLPVVLKMFFAKDSINTQSELTEANIYKYITKNIILTKESECFVSYIGLARCQDILKNIDKEIIDKKKILERIYQMEKKEEIKDDIYILITEQIENNISFSKFIKNSENIKEKDLFKIILLILHALYIMTKHKIQHNDDHFGNILIKELNEPKKFLIKVGNKKFSVKSKYQPYIFDWDRGFIENKIENPYLSEKRCHTRSSAECGKFNPKRDIYTFACNLDDYLSKSDRYPRIKKFLYEHIDPALITLNKKKSIPNPPHHCRLALRDKNMDVITTLPNSKSGKKYYLDTPLEWFTDF